MFVRLILTLAIALGFSASAAQACQCRPHHVVRPRPACAPCRPVVYRHHRHHVRTRVIEKVVHIQKIERYDDRAYRFAEADEQRWRAGGRVWGAVRPSPPHPWDTDPNGYLTWPGKTQGYAVEDRYSGQPRAYDPRNEGCPDNCPLPPPPGMMGPPPAQP
ncbi:hypothetical protein [Phenylobacterium montanum]|uniref:Uncharacterized protein n=1 Tax=Phenylobacterium montanum TaxID=2823693 RepID=A0A975FXU0_9CAUL|nr:hypothetical protein [Caulobacter sp. S6]QUD86949.1 hypothetical protein KCG34_18000 [Caulobacter sp. S6]